MPFSPQRLEGLFRPASLRHLHHGGVHLDPGYGAVRGPRYQTPAGVLDVPGKVLNLHFTRGGDDGEGGYILTFSMKKQISKSSDKEEQ